MKTLKKFKTLFMVAALACSAMVLGACSSSKNSNIDADGNVTYKVTVKDALGDPYTSGMVVKFLQNGEQAAMQVGDEAGVVEKKLTAGEYDVEVSFTAGDEGYHYEKEGLKVTTENNEIEVIVAYVPEAGKALIIDNEEHDTYNVSVGCSYVTLDTARRNYYLFTPTEAGLYEFSVADNAKVEIGYYGAPHYVQEISAATVTDGKFTVNVKDSMIGSGDTGTTIIVVGIDVADDSQKNCVLCIDRVSDPILDMTDAEWTIYKKTATLSAYTLPAGATLGEFDIKSTTGYSLVLNETDGFYHLDSADGPLVLVRLTEDPKYVSCLKTILDNTGVNKYFFDENGEFVKKESYSECLLEYIEYVDETAGVYPLTEDLKYIIQQSGEYRGWFDDESNNYLFLDANGNPETGVNSDISWLFMCCYIAN